MISLDKSRVNGRRALVLERVCRAELLLIANEHDLLCIESAEESFMLLYHSGFVHNDSSELTTADLISAGFAHCCHNDRASRDDLLLKGKLQLLEFEKLPSCEHLDLLDIDAEQAAVFLIHHGLLLSNEVGVPLPSCRLNLSRKVHDLEDVLNG